MDGTASLRAQRERVPTIEDFALKGSLGTGRRKPDSVRPGRIRPSRTIISLDTASRETAPPCRSRVRLIPGFIPRPKPRGRTGGPFTLFCLAPHGVYPAPSVTLGAVSSYLAISPLPLVAQRAPKGGIFSATLSVTPPLRRSAPAFTGHAAVRCPDFPLNPEGNSDHLRPVPSGEPTRDQPPAPRED